MAGASAGAPPHAPAKTVKVLYVAGVPQCGSTILGNVLGELPGVFAGGEISSIWGYLESGPRCGCGALLRECATWGKIMKAGFGRVIPADAGLVQAKLNASIKARHFPHLLLARWLRRRPPRVADGELNARLGQLYHAMAVETGCAVIVDMSKHVAYPSLLESIPGIDLYVVELVRDPRAVAFSQSGVWMYLRGLGAVLAAVYSGLFWFVSYAFAELAWRGRKGRFLLLRYEDFVRAPADSVRQITDMLGLGPASLPVQARSVRLGENHNVAGNSNRFRIGDVPIEPDERWRRAMRRRLRSLVLLLTWPLFLRYYGPFYRARRPGGRIL